MKKTIFSLAVATLIAVTATFGVSAAVYSDTNKNIDIIYGEFTGFKFSGEDAPGGGIDASEIAAVKFYLKIETPIEEIDTPFLELAYNSGTTDWVSKEYDLDDGLIVTMDLEETLSEDDFFEAGVITWNEGVTGTFSVEALDSSGNVLGNAIYDNTPSQTEPIAQTQSPTTEPQQTGAQTKEPSLPKANNVPGERTMTTQPPATASATTHSNAVGTGSTNIITASVMTALSAWAIASMRKKRK